MRAYRPAAFLTLLVTLHITGHPTRLAAQTARDTLSLGRLAYERADFAGAARLLPVGLTAGGSRTDTLWVGGVHMLTDALLELGQDSLAAYWARWATRLTAGFPIDSVVYPPRVARALSRAQAAVGAPMASDSLVNDALDEATDAPAGKGLLRIQRGGQGILAVVEGMGTMLPGETRTLPPGSYTLRLTGVGLAPLTITREVLPGYATVVTPRLARPGEVAVAAAGAAAPAAAPASGAPVRPEPLAANGANTCATIDGGALVCWGSNAAGQLGNGAADSVLRTPATVRADAPWAAVSVGATHSCALTREGRGWCWGLGTSGELGNGSSASSPVPVAVSGTQGFVQISVGATHSCALTGAGAAFCWGANRAGVLGNRTAIGSAVPVAVAAPPNVTFSSMSAGAGHTCAIASNGPTWCWGANAGGQLGNGSTAEASSPVLVQTPTAFKALAPGAMHTCALATNGAAWCWGASGSGALGTGTSAGDNLRPAPVAGGLTFTAIASGDGHSCGLTDDGAAYCWGSGRAGQLGTGQLADSPRPSLVVGGHVFRALALGSQHSCALADDRTVWCWGGNGDGQLGALGGRGSAIPVPVVTRPATRNPAATAPTQLRESFGDGNWTAAPAWLADSAPGLRLAISDSALEVARSGARGQVAAGGITIPVRVPVTRATQIQFDVMVQSGMPCGLNCANYPAVIRVRVRNSDLTESEVWYAYGERSAQSRNLGAVVIVARGDLAAGRWQRGQRFTIRDALPRADTILQVSLGGVGTDFAARFDNVLVPVPVPTALVLTPDSVRINATGPAAAPTRLRAVVVDATGTDIPDLRISWSSADTSVARVDSTGLVTPVANGRTTVRAVSGALSAGAVVQVQLGRRPPAARRQRPR